MHDVAILGGGPGGYATAFRAAAHGLDVALVEADRVGGTCLHRGCIPSKALLHVAGVLEELGRGGEMGIRARLEPLDGERLAGFRDGVVARMHEGLAALARARATVHAQRGRVVAGERPAIELIDGTRVEARHVVVATGSRPRALPVAEIDGEVVQTSDQALFGAHPPRRAVIVGAGAIGVEFAAMWAPMGAEVTLVEALDRVLPLEDPDVSAAMREALARRGVAVRTGARLQAVERDGGQATVRLADGDDPVALSADRVLVAVGREPATDDCGLDALGVLEPSGHVRTDAWGQTDVAGLWAVGDVRDTLALAHAAFAEGAVVADRIAGLPAAPVDPAQVPRVTYGRPEVASVGLTEPAARERHGEVAVTTTSMAHNARGLLHGGEGLVKVIHRVDRPPTGAPGAAGPVVGVHVLAPQATELIAAATMATSWEAVPVELAGVTHPHPTLSEALSEAFQSAAGLPRHAL